MIDANAPVEVFEELDSTMLEARRRVESGDLGPVWLVALRQNAGRGRRGRSWVSAPGNLYVTYLAPDARKPTELALVGFAAGLAICDAIETEIGTGWETRLKWPNDVFIEGAKVSGMMLDSGAAADGRTWLALGMGVNLVTGPEGLDQPTTYLSAYEQLTEPLDFLALLRPRLARWDAILREQGFEPLRKAWLASAYKLGHVIRVAVGAQTLQGRFTGLSPRGELELETETGMRLIAAGDVLLTSAA